jgi:hypothetical protein
VLSPNDGNGIDNRKLYEHTRLFLACAVVEDLEPSPSSPSAPGSHGSGIMSLPVKQIRGQQFNHACNFPKDREKQN